MSAHRRVRHDGRMTAARPRIEWMDVIKATAVIVIVLSHAVDLTAPVAGGQPAQTFWQVVMTIVEPMRMPLFFMISGMLAASALNRPWNKVRRRTWGMVYLYVLWSAIFFAVVACYVRAPVGEQLLTYLKLILVAGNGYWYLYALVIYFCLVKVTQRWPIWILFSIAIVLSLLKEPILTLNREHLLGPGSGSMFVKVLINLVFYLIGIHFKAIIERIAAMATWPRIIGITGILVLIGLWRYNTPWSWEQSFLPASLLYIVLAVMLASTLVVFPKVRAYGIGIGRETLPIFVVQFPFMLILQQVFKNQYSIYDNQWFLAIFPIAFTAFDVVFALWLFRITKNNFGRYLFEVPHWVARDERSKPQVKDSDVSK